MWKVSYQPHRGCPAVGHHLLVTNLTGAPLFSNSDAGKFDGSTFRIRFPFDSGYIISLVATSDPEGIAFEQYTVGIQTFITRSIHSQLIEFGDCRPVRHFRRDETNYPPRSMRYLFAKEMMVC